MTRLTITQTTPEMSKLAVIFALFLAGCASGPIVNVPIPIKPPVAPVAERPHNYLIEVQDEALDACEASGERCGEVMRAWEATLESVTGWGLELEALLKTYQ